MMYWYRQPTTRCSIQSTRARFRRVVRKTRKIHLANGPWPTNLSSPIGFCLFSALIVFFASEASADAAKKTSEVWRVGNILVEQAWARVTSREPKRGGVYLTVHNKSPDLDYLLAAESPNAVSITIYEAKNVDGKVQLNPIPGGLNLEGHREIVMRPDGIQLILTGVTNPGGKIPLQLIFLNAGKLTIDVPVYPLSAKFPPVVHKEH